MKFKDYILQTEMKLQFVGYTSKDHGHKHKAFVDGNGDGKTSKDDGHIHKISVWNVKKAEDGHTHDLKRDNTSEV
jgi:hypothetical protein